MFYLLSSRLIGYNYFGIKFNIPTA